MYVDEEKQDYSDVNQMKDKTCIILVVGTSASGRNNPLGLVGRPKNPEFFKLIYGARPPLLYKNQANYRFD